MCRESRIITSVIKPKTASATNSDDASAATENRSRRTSAATPSRKAMAMQAAIPASHQNRPRPVWSFCMNAGGLNSQQNSIHAVSAAANDKMPKIGKRLGLVFMRKDVFLFDVIRAHNHRVGERGVNVDALHGVGFQDPAADDEAVKAMDV